MDLNDLRDIHDSRGPKPEIMKYRPISADSHMTEPVGMYAEYMSPAFRDRAPKLVEGAHGEMLVLEGVSTQVPLGTLASAGRDPKDILFKKNRAEDLDPAGWEPAERLKRQDEDGIFAEILYPTVGMVISQVADPDLQSDMILAYNRWMTDFCAHDTTRLIGIGQTPCVSPSQTIADLRRMKAQGFRGAYLPGYPIWPTDYDHEDWNPVWEACVEQELPICFHVFGGKKPGSNDWQDTGRGPAICGWHQILRDNQDLIGMFIFGGVFERHPGLKMVSVEADAGWAPHFAYRMDHMYLRHRYWQKAIMLKEMPSHYFFKNVWLTFQDDVVAFKTIDLMNVDRIMWANDYPHSDSTWPWSHALLREQTAGLTEHQKHRVLHDNVKELYKLDIA
jgi:predicted TIM-barrel fold metal-dependent hydrolase